MSSEKAKQEPKPLELKNVVLATAKFLNLMAREKKLHVGFPLLFSTRLKEQAIPVTPERVLSQAKGFALEKKDDLALKELERVEAKLNSLSEKQRALIEKELEKRLPKASTPYEVKLMASRAENLKQAEEFKARNKYLELQARKIQERKRERSRRSKEQASKALKAHWNKTKKERDARKLIDLTWKVLDREQNRIERERKSEAKQRRTRETAMKTQARRVKGRPPLKPEKPFKFWRSSLR